MPGRARNAQTPAITTTLKDYGLSRDGQEGEKGVSAQRHSRDGCVPELGQSFLCDLMVIPLGWNLGLNSLRAFIAVCFVLVAVALRLFFFPFERWGPAIPAEGALMSRPEIAEPAEGLRRKLARAHSRAVLPYQQTCQPAGLCRLGGQLSAHRDDAPDG